MHARLYHSAAQAALGDGAGVVRGTVRDRSGAAVPGAPVILANATGVAARATSGPDGRYQLNAPAGVYSLRFELPGFSPRVFEECACHPARRFSRT